MYFVWKKLVQEYFVFGDLQKSAEICKCVTFLKSKKGHNVFIG